MSRKLNSILSLGLLALLVGCGGKSLSINDGPNGNNSFLGGSGAANLVISDADPSQFGTQTNSFSINKSFTVYNTGGVAASGLLISPPSASGAYSVQTPPINGLCSNGQVLAPSQGCLIYINFLPTLSLTGVQTGSFSISYLNGSTPNPIVLTRNLSGTGTGVQQGNLSLSIGSSYNFNSVPVGSYSDQPIIVTNSGPVAATGFLFSIPAGGNYSLTGQATLPNSTLAPCIPAAGAVPPIAANGQCFVVVRFNPSLPVNVSTLVESLTATVSATIAVGNTQTLSVAFSGTAVLAANLSLAGNPANFQSVVLPIAAPVQGCMVLTNSGGIPASNISLGVLNAPFAYAAVNVNCIHAICGSALGANSICDIPVTFNPAASGNYTQNFPINYNSGSVAVSLTGTISGSGAAVTTTNWTKNGLLADIMDAHVVTLPGQNGGKQPVQAFINHDFSLGVQTVYLRSASGKSIGRVFAGQPSSITNCDGSTPGLAGWFLYFRDAVGTPIGNFSVNHQDTRYSIPAYAAAAGVRVPAGAKTAFIGYFDNAQNGDAGSYFDNEGESGRNPNSGSTNGCTFSMDVVAAY